MIRALFKTWMINVWIINMAVGTVCLATAILRIASAHGFLPATGLVALACLNYGIVYFHFRN